MNRNSIAINSRNRPFFCFGKKQELYWPNASVTQLQLSRTISPNNAFTSGNWNWWIANAAVHIRKESEIFVCYLSARLCWHLAFGIICLFIYSFFLYCVTLLYEWWWWWLAFGEREGRVRRRLSSLIAAIVRVSEPSRAHTVGPLPSYSVWPPEGTLKHYFTATKRLLGPHRPPP